MYLVPGDKDFTSTLAGFFRSDTKAFPASGWKKPLSLPCECRSARGLCRERAPKAPQYFPWHLQQLLRGGKRFFFFLWDNLASQLQRSQCSCSCFHVVLSVTTTSPQRRHSFHIASEMRPPPPGTMQQAKTPRPLVSSSERKARRKREKGRGDNTSRTWAKILGR